MGLQHISPVLAQSETSAPKPVQAPTDAELRDRGLKLIANQHKNDEALDQYERIEHEVDRTGGANPRTLVDKTTRLAPNGSGTTKILLEDSGRRVTPEEYRRELLVWQNVAQFMLTPNDERTKSASSKYSKRKQTRTQLVDAMMGAFTLKWIGREMRNGRDCDVVTLTPSAGFHPKSIFEEALTHASAKIWVDHDANQLVRAEALITSDISVGGGVLGKLYKGGTFVMEQTEAAPGVWLPSRYRYDFTGRKFLFSFEEHQSIEASHYRYIGSAKEALAVVQAELASGQAMSGDP